MHEASVAGDTGEAAEVMEQKASAAQQEKTGDGSSESQQTVVQLTKTWVYSLGSSAKTWQYNAALQDPTDLDSVHQAVSNMQISSVSVYDVIGGVRDLTTNVTTIRLAYPESQDGSTVGGHVWRTIRWFEDFVTNNQLEYKTLTALLYQNTPYTLSHFWTWVGKNKCSKDRKVSSSTVTMSHVEDTGMASHMEELGSLSDQEQLLNDDANWFEATPDHGPLANLTEKFSARLNWEKSEALAVGEWRESLHVLPKNLIWKQDGLKYLGLYIRNEDMVKKNWEGLTEKIKIKLEKWYWTTVCSEVPYRTSWLRLKECSQLYFQVH